VEARQHIATLRRAAPDITIEIRWCPVYEGVEGNEKADEWAKLAADEPDTQGVEGWTYSDRPEETPLPKSLANIRREISEKDGGSTVGRRPDLQKQVQDAEKPEAGRHGCWKHQEACLKVLPAEDGALPHW